MICMYLNFYGIYIEKKILSTWHQNGRPNLSSSSTDHNMERLYHEFFFRVNIKQEGVRGWARENWSREEIAHLFARRIVEEIAVQILMVVLHL